MNKQFFRGKYVSAILYQGISGNWVTDISYIGVKSFKCKEDAINHLERYGAFQ
ncbi:hypothetical protein [Oceanobacillus kimchii]|uniref:hypothetical protein n=1 Tax=Oceanobacillus kimchii TaxID=746691 RepID=UPI00232B6E90|nr:hypothetical protein [Oceanobacillus kimchii]